MNFNDVVSILLISILFAIPLFIVLQRLKELNDLKDEVAAAKTEHEKYNTKLAQRCQQTGSALCGYFAGNDQQAFVDWMQARFERPYEQVKAQQDLLKLPLADLVGLINAIPHVLNDADVNLQYQWMIKSAMDARTTQNLYEEAVSNYNSLRSHVLSRMVAWLVSGMDYLSKLASGDDSNPEPARKQMQGRDS